MGETVGWTAKAWARIKRNWWLPGVVAFLLVLVGLGCFFGLYGRLWNWLGDNSVSNGDRLRNLALAMASTLGGLIGLPLAAWRSDIARRQVEAANRQVETANRQAETAERGHRDGRYEKCVDMLGSDVLTTRMGGISGLNRLASTHSEEYHVQVMEALASLIRFPTGDEKLEKRLGWPQSGEGDAGSDRKPARPDVEKAAQVIGQRRRALQDKGKLEGAKDDFWPDLSGASLSEADLREANLSRSNLSWAYLREAYLREAYLRKANLSKANLSGADLSGAKGLTQAQLDAAII